MFLGDMELDAAIDAARAEVKRLVRLRRDRRWAANARANPDKMRRKFTPEIRAKLSAAHKGIARTPAERARISAGLTRYWRDKRGEADTWEQLTR